MFTLRYPATPALWLTRPQMKAVQLQSGRRRVSRRRAAGVRAAALLRLVLLRLLLLLPHAGSLGHAVTPFPSAGLSLSIAAEAAEGAPPTSWTALDFVVGRRPTPPRH